jgi:hypothetical protein
MSDWQACQRGWWLKYYRHLTPKHAYSSPLNVGSLVHGALEEYYKAAMDTADPPPPVQYVHAQLTRIIEANPDLEAEIVKDAQLAIIMVDGYYEWLEAEGADAGLRVVGTETMVEAPVGDYILRGKIDARLLRELDGKLLQLEHKTVGNFTDIPKYAQSAPQFLTYDLLAYLTKPDGVPTDGILVNMLRKVKRTASAKPPFYDRLEIRHSKEELRSHWQHVQAIGDQISRARRLLDAGVDHHLVVPPSVHREHTWRCDCHGVTVMIDHEDDVEGYLAEHWEAHDPMERYKEVT